MQHMPSFPSVSDDELPFTYSALLKRSTVLVGNFQRRLLLHQARLLVG
jgi:hypothetical protein